MSKNVDKKYFSVNIQTFTHIFHVCNTCTVLFTYLTLSYWHLLNVSYLLYSWVGRSDVM